MTTLTERMRRNPLKYVALVLSSPIIYGLIIPIVISDICGTLYQAICFRIYGVPLVRRADYIVLGRGKLKYLNLFDRLNCLYCEYANGVAAYAAEIVARTEWYWCPIKHDRNIKAPHAYYGQFIENGDSENIKEKMRQQREKCRACEVGCASEGKT